MLTRLQGLVMIVNTLLPLALLLGITVGICFLEGRFRRALGKRSNRSLSRSGIPQTSPLSWCRRRRTRVTTHLASAGEGLDAVGKEFAKAAVTVEPVLQTMEQDNGAGFESNDYP